MITETTVAESRSRVPKHTSESLNRRIRLVTIANIEACAEQPQTINQRLRELDKEWDVERLLQTNASCLALSGVLLGVFRNPKFLFLTGAVLAFLLQHSIQGWCPPLPVLRRMGIRTRDEINQEREALKLLRGDYSAVSISENGLSDVQPVLDVVGLSRH